MNSVKSAPSTNYKSESITTLYEKNPTDLEFCSLDNITQEWEFENISENSEVDLLRTTTVLEIQDELTIIFQGTPTIYVIDNLTFNDPWYEVNTSSVTQGEIPEYTFFTGTNIEIGITDSIIPNKVCNFQASDNIPFMIECTWSQSDGIPDATYDLLNESGDVLASGVNSPYQLLYQDITENFTGTFKVQSKNSVGSVDSNTDQGTAIAKSGPGLITDFSATDDECNSITITFTPATGSPEPTYDLYQDNNMIVQGVSSGYQVQGNIVGSEFFVRAINSEGETNSNTDTGTSYWLPEQVTDFQASDSNQDGIVCTWSQPQNPGNPVCTYDLYRDDLLFQENVESGVIDNTMANEESFVYFVKQKNDCGEIDSNTDQGIRAPLCVPDSIEYNTPSETPYIWEPSPGCIGQNAELCMIGGGGGGDIGVSTGVKGGNAGDIISQNLNIEQSNSIEIGIGGSGYKSSLIPSQPGTSSYFNTIIAQGGDPGSNNSGYSGVGNIRTTCYGTAYDGELYSQAYMGYGGEAGFGDGGDGGYGFGLGDPTVEAGIKGSGAGGRWAGVTSQSGGDGVCKVTWGNYKGKPKNVSLFNQDELKKYKITVYPGIQDKNEAYQKFRKDANTLIAKWEIQGYNWEKDYSNSSSVIRYRTQIEEIKRKLRAKSPNLL